MIRIIPGDITVENVRGYMDGSSWVIDVSTLEKYVAAECTEEGTDWTVVILYADENTLRRGDRIDGPNGSATQILLPPGFECAASRGRYTARITGVRKPPVTDEPWPVLPWKTVEEFPTIDHYTLHAQGREEPIGCTRGDSEQDAIEQALPQKEWESHSARIVTPGTVCPVCEEEA